MSAIGTWKTNLFLMIAPFLLWNHQAFSSEVLREANVTPECQIVTWCDDNYEDTDANNVTVLNSETGTVKVFLEERFESNMKLDISYNDSTCDNGGGAIPYIRRYTCKMPENFVSSNCSHQEIIFQYLVTGCYTIYNAKDEELGTFPVTTNYTLKNLEDNCSVSVTTGLMAERYTHIWIELKQFDMNNTLKLYLTASDCGNIPNETELWWTVEIKENQYKNIIIERNIPGNGSVDCLIDQQRGFQELHCEVDWEKNKCLTIYREATNNPIGYPGTGDEFIYFNIEQAQFPKKINKYFGVTISMTGNVFFPIIIPLLGVSMCLSAIQMFRKRNEFKSEASETDEMMPKSPHNLKYKVLLLYPQDCKKFMDIMRSLKDVLQSINYFEVFDYFDPQTRFEIDPDPQGWMSKLILDKDVRIILSETNMSVLCQTYIHKKRLINYVNPKPHNTLYTYGLQMLLQSIRLEQYRRIFLIRVDDDTLQKLELSHYQRFKLPEHLGSLISCITSNNVISFEDAVEVQEMERLSCTIKQFKEYGRNNPFYHHELIKSTREVI